MEIVAYLLVLYVAIALLILFSYPSSKRDFDKSISKGLGIFVPRKEKRPYFSVHHFTSGWDEAKKSLPQFILFVILSPLIFVSWLIWKIFGRDKPKDFKRVYPSGGRPEGTRAYPQDDKAVKMVLESEMPPRVVFDVMRSEYFADEIWNAFSKAEREQAFDSFRNRIADQMEKNS